VIENVQGAEPVALDERDEDEDAKEGDPPPAVAVTGVVVALLAVVEILGEVGELSPK